MNRYNIYYKLPVTVQNLLISAYGLYWKNHRFGGHFEGAYNEALKREVFTNREWLTYQEQNLRQVLTYAFDNVPFYQEKYKKAGIDKHFLSTITLDRLIEIPFLSKEEFRQYGKTTLLSTKRNKGIFTHSSGSTGTPTSIYMSKSFHQKWFGICEARIRKWAGVDKNTPRGMIGGRRIIPDSELKPPFYRYNIFEKQTYFSAYHLNKETVYNYLEGIYKNNVKYMTGYAVSNYLLAKLIEEQGLKAPQLKAVITSSEKLTKEMRDTISHVYKCKVYDTYSGSEACGLISESPEGMLLLSPDAGIMEFLKSDNSYAKPGESGEIISTGFLNYDQPLIRYRIGDLAKLSKDQVPVGERNMTIIDEITGRLEDIIVGADGRVMVRFHSIFLELRGLKLSQLVQHNYTNYSINLVIDPFEFIKNEAETIIMKRLKSQLGEVTVSFNYLDHIPLQPNGKFKAVVSEITV